ncbi:unnamed protein product, partial [Symbiodinium sp. CCMP2456]
MLRFVLLAQAAQACQDAVPLWADSEGRTCQDYVNNNWCTSTGKYGAGWNFNQGERHKNFASFRNANYTAFQACCGCGAHASEPSCNETSPGWVDSAGYTCTDYVRNSWCTPTGHYGSGWDTALWKSFGHYANQGKSALEACCGCGSEALVNSSTCTDLLSGWTDAVENSCDVYVTHEWCTMAGDYGPGFVKDLGRFSYHKQWGLDATQACCGCGAASCNDTVENWVDSNRYTCAEYVDNQWCTRDGAYGSGWDMSWGTFGSRRNGGYSAVEACCGCGATFALLQCQDAAVDWVDSQGNTCPTYVLNSWCTAEGSYGEGWDFSWGTFASLQNQGLSADQACCGCGAKQSSPTCVDVLPGWSDSEGNTCQDYVTNSWCTSTGRYGSGWNMSERRSFGHHANQSASALEACCGCGARSGSCQDPVPGWVDALGYMCQDYVSNHWCALGGYGLGWDFRSWGSFANVANFGFTALEACCCGTGSGPAANPCMDAEAWFDSEMETCQAYGRRQWCGAGAVGPGWDSAKGRLADFVSPWENTTAWDTCCTCGGGTPCTDLPNWADSIGRSCSAYASACATTTNRSFFEGYAVQNVSALDACCACRGRSTEFMCSDTRHADRVLRDAADLVHIAGCRLFQSKVVITGSVSDLSALQITGVRELSIDATAELRTLNGLQGTFVKASLEVVNNAVLESISEIGKLNAALDSLTVNDNAMLSDVLGLQDVMEVAGSVLVRRNEKIKSLAGLGNLRLASDIRITHNPELKSLHGLESLRTLNAYHMRWGRQKGTLNVQNLDRLESISALAGLKGVLAGDITLQRNPVL